MWIRIKATLLCVPLACIFMLVFYGIWHDYLTSWHGFIAWLKIGGNPLGYLFGMTLTPYLAWMCMRSWYHVLRYGREPDE